MAQSAPSWRLPLEERPRIWQASVAVHGHAPVERYLLRGLWCIHLYRYRGSVAVAGVAGQELAIRPGRLSILPPSTELIYRYASRRCVHVYAHFQLTGRPGRAALLPAMQDLGADLPWVDEAMGVISSSFLSQPLRAEVKLWDLLLHLADRPAEASPESPPRAQSHPAFRQAIEMIEAKLAEPLTVAGLAKRVGLSHNQLTRLFRAGAGATVIAYLRRRRALRARHLLRRSTLPLKHIAASVGLGDPHQFNKVIRRELGASPRTIRAMGNARGG